MQVNIPHSSHIQIIVGFWYGPKSGFQLYFNDDEHAPADIRMSTYVDSLCVLYVIGTEHT